MLVRAIGEHSEVDPEQANIRVLSTEGKLIWETKDTAERAVVTDDGQVIAVNEAGELVIYGRDGQIVKKVNHFFGAGSGNFFIWWRHVPQHNLVMMCDGRRLAAVSYDEEILWRYSIPDMSNDSIGEADFDPLGRGVYVLVHHGKDTRVDLIDARSGRISNLWEHKPFTPRYFSPSGRYVATMGGITLADWRNGQTLFSRSLNQDGSRVPLSGGPMSVSDTPLLAVPANEGMEVFNAAGEKIWSISLRNIQGAIPVLSKDGQTLAILVTRQDGVQLIGLLLYQIE